MIKNLNKEKIIERIADIRASILELEKFEKMSAKEFTKNQDNYSLACFHLRVALEAVLTIGTHILARIPTNGKKKDYTQVILSLGKYEVIPENFAEKIKGMAGYRNRLVHLYWKVEPEEILSTIKKDLDDFNKFIKHIENFIKK